MNFLMELTGTFAATFAILLNLAMLLQIRDMWNNKTHKGINPIMILFMFLNSFFWTMYGFLKQNLNVIIPNLLGAIFTPVVLFLIVYFAHKKYVEDKMKEEHIKPN
ncbi:MAG: SWEET family sugar transporter [Methanobrevibacter sp.]|nr:SWEET family sugar transporter [Candidatus Methanovirga australis]